MYVKAMKVLKAEPHPNAETLRIYAFSVGGDNSVSVIANLENVYEEGDVVAVALEGVVLQDGTKISKRKLRGVGSYGMALGKTEADVGTDLTRVFCHPDYAPDLTPQLVKWPSIELLHNVLRSLEKRQEYMGDEYVSPSVTYRAKVKLHGTNGAIQLVGSDVVAQSRTVILDGGGRGFYQWVQAHRDVFRSAAIRGKHLTIFGEWCGPGVQKGVAVSKLDKKIFAVFGAQVGLGEDSVLEVRPEALRELVPEHPDIYVLPWFGSAVTLDFGNAASLELSAAVMNQLVAQVEGEDPWVKEIFGVSGVGEGLVWYPDPEVTLPWYCPYHEMLFKTKGEKHAVVKQKAPVQLAPEVVAGIDGFVDLFVTEARLDQILSQIAEAPSRRDTGKFLVAFKQDVIKESEAELEAAGLVWVEVDREVSTRARDWFLSRVENG